MFGLVLALVCTQAPAEKMIYFPGLEWHNDVELKAGEKVTLVGYSAGARIASLMAFDPANKGKIDKVVLLSGVYKVGPFVRVFSKGAFRGMSTGEVSPLYNVPPADKDSPEFTMYYASHDLPGLRHQTMRFYNALVCNGYKVTLTEVCATHRSIPTVLGYED